MNVMRDGDGSVTHCYCRRLPPVLRKRTAGVTSPEPLPEPSEGAARDVRPPLHVLASPPSPAPSRGSRMLHLHWFRWAGEDRSSPHNLYACRCGVVRPGF